MRPTFLVTIDTEGDDLWARPRSITTRNAEHLPRFQAVCERYGLKPTYLATYEMATSPAFQELGRGVLRRGTGEVGMHLHAWNSPPLVPITPDDLRFQPFLIEYPEPVVREKVARLTGTLEDAFGVKMVSHRAGRWAFDETYARILVEHGYLVDCSVTPRVSWRHHLGAPGRSGGSDYTRFPAGAYFVDLDDIRRAGDSPLLEIPMTIERPRWTLVAWVPGGWTGHPRARTVLDRLCPKVWLRPRGGNLSDLLWLVEEAARGGGGYLQFMLHSSELMPGGSPTFRTEAAIEGLYADLEALFASVNGRFEGATLGEYRQALAEAGEGRARPGDAARGLEPSHADFGQPR